MPTAVHQTTTTTTRSSGGGGKGCYCAWSWPFMFAVMDLVIGICATVQSCLLMFVGTNFRSFVVGLVGLCMGVGIVSSTTFTCELVYNQCLTRFGFFWTWAGRGLFYIVVGCIVATDPKINLLGFITFCLCCLMGFIYVTLECCACCSTGMPKTPSPLCGPQQGGSTTTSATTTTRSQQVKTNTPTQNPFGNPKNELDTVC